MKNQNLDKIFVFDLDNTLIKTDRANLLAYNEAIRIVLGEDYTIDSDKRITRNDLKNVFSSLSQVQFESIIAHKERLFESYIGETILNKNLLKILKQLHSEHCMTILMTNSHSKRALQLCAYFKLSQYFVQQFFHENHFGSKYSFLTSLGYDLKNIILYENDERAIMEAVNSGIKFENVIKVEL